MVYVAALEGPTSPRATVMAEQMVWEAAREMGGATASVLERRYRDSRATGVPPSAWRHGGRMTVSGALGEFTTAPAKLEARGVDIERCGIGATRCHSADSRHRAREAVDAGHPRDTGERHL